MPRTNSTDRSVGDQITAIRLQDLNEDIDDLYSGGSDRLRVVEADSGTALRIDIGAGVYNVGGVSGQYAGGTDIAVTDDATNYVQIDSGGTIQIATDTRNEDYTNLAKVTAASGAITTIELRKADAIGWAIGGTNALTVGFVIEYGEAVTVETNKPMAGYIHTDGKGYLSDMDGTTNEDKADFVFIESGSSGDFKNVIVFWQIDRDGTAGDDLWQNNHRQVELQGMKNTQGTSVELIYGGGYGGVNKYCSQPVEPTLDMTVSQVLVRVGRYQNSGQSYTVRVETDDWSGWPSGTLVDANATVGGTASTYNNTSNQTLTFPWTFTLSANTVYHVVVTNTKTTNSYILGIAYHASTAFANAPGERLNRNESEDGYLNFRLIDSTATVVDFETDTIEVNTLGRINSTKPWVGTNHMLGKQITSTKALIVAGSAMFNYLNV